METLKRLYMAFICPHHEYATAVWDPCLSKDIQKLESVQRFACRVCTKRWDDSYSDMLHILNIPPLSERRRKLLKVCHLYKIVHWFIDFPKERVPLVLKPFTDRLFHIMLKKLPIMLFCNAPNCCLLCYWFSPNIPYNMLCMKFIIQHKILYFHSLQF